MSYLMQWNYSTGHASMLRILCTTPCLLKKINARVIDNYSSAIMFLALQYYYMYAVKDIIFNMYE